MCPSVIRLFREASNGQASGKNRKEKVLTTSILISIADQTLSLYGDEGVLFASYPVSTAAKGPGEARSSEQTPRGKHRIRVKIGQNCPINTVFIGRRATGEIYSPALGIRHPGRDWILTRILWLCGMEVGKNRLSDVDTMARYIYIHGVPDEKNLSKPCSKGCINMKNSDIVDLFNRVPVGTIVDIVE